MPVKPRIRQDWDLLYPSEFLCVKTAQRLEAGWNKKPPSEVKPQQKIAFSNSKAVIFTRCVLRSERVSNTFKVHLLFSCDRQHTWLSRSEVTTAEMLIGFRWRWSELTLLLSMGKPPVIHQPFSPRNYSLCDMTWTYCNLSWNHFYLYTR